MTFLIISFIAGILTVLAPCILPLLPVIVGGSIVEGENKHKSFVIIGALMLSIIIFTLILKWSTTFINVPQYVWTLISGSILILFAISMIFPGLWERLPFTSVLSLKSNKLLGTGYQKKSLWGDIIMGAALGPVFSSCSPTYFVILATVLPQSFSKGLLYLLAYALGLGLSLLIIVFVGQKIIGRIGAVSDPRSIFKRSIGILFLLVGIAILTGYDKKIEEKLLNGTFDITKIETKLLQQADKTTSLLSDPLPPTTQSVSEDMPDILAEALPTASGMPTAKQFMTLIDKAKKYPQYTEITNPSGFVNTDGLPITIAEHVGREVIMIDFMTYSCINCKRTFPYLNTWYEKYQDDGFLIIGIHTPEFAFEKNIGNVTDAMADAGIMFPIVLDNDYGTWNAYKNSYWPRKYLIDIDGYVVYDHIGEGEYEKTEAKIVELLAERAVRLGMTAPQNENGSDTITPVSILTSSPETYLGSARQGNFVNENTASGCKAGACIYTLPATIPQNSFALGGTWSASDEFMTLTSPSGSIQYHFIASKVYLVASNSSGPVDADILIDGRPIAEGEKGSDVDAQGHIRIDGANLYNIADFGGTMAEHTIEIRANNAGLEAYTFTFG